MAIVCLLFKCKFDWDFNFYLVFWLSFNQFGFEIDLRIDQIPSLSTEFIWTKEKEINSITLLFQCMISIRNFKQSSKMMALSHASSYHGWKVICWFWNRFVWCLDSRIFFLCVDYLLSRGPDFSDIYANWSTEMFSENRKRSSKEEKSKYQ